LAFFFFSFCYSSLVQGAFDLKAVGSLHQVLSSFVMTMKETNKAVAGRDDRSYLPKNV